MPQETQDQPSPEEVQSQSVPGSPAEAENAPAVEPKPADAQTAEGQDVEHDVSSPADQAPAAEAAAAESTADQTKGAAEAPQEAAEAEGDDLPECTFQAEDVGTLKKKVTITVPAERIEAKREEMFGELARTAQVPGFRIGRAPRRLIEKRFGREVSEDVRNAVVGESLGQVEDKTRLKAVGEPDLKLNEIKLPDSGPLVYSFEVEVAPEFDLPKLEGIPVEKHTIEADDERIDQMLEEWRLSFARYQATEGAAAEGDTVVVAAAISGEEIEPVRRDGVVLRVAPGQIEGLPLVDLGAELVGKKAGQTARLAVDVAQAHPNEAWRGKRLAVELTINEVRKRVLPEMDDEFARSHGMETLEELREAVGKSLAVRVGLEIQRLMRDQIRQYLLDNTELDVPEGAAERHTARVLQRRYVDLLQQGVPRERIEEDLTAFQAAAGEEVRRQLKLEFILGRIAEEKEFEVTDEEVNSRVAEMARQAGRRPERLRQELETDGSLAVVRTLLRDEKVLDFLLGQAEVTEVTVEEPKPEEPKRKKKARKKAAKGKATKRTPKEEKAPADKAEEPPDKPSAQARKKAKKTAKKKP